MGGACVHIFCQTGECFSLSTRCADAPTGNCPLASNPKNGLYFAGNSCSDVRCRVDQKNVTCVSPTQTKTSMGTVNMVNPQGLFWHLEPNLTATVTLNGSTVGPIRPHYQSSGPVLVANTCAPIMGAAQLSTDVVGVFKLTADTQYTFSVAWSDGRRTMGNVWTAQNGTCFTRRLPR